MNYVGVNGGTRRTSGRYQCALCWIISFSEESNEIKQFYGIFNEARENAYVVEACENSSRRPDFMQCARILSTEVAESGEKACHQF